MGNPCSFTFSDNGNIHFRHMKLQKLSLVLKENVDCENIDDPDETYELTADNVKKILAIHMRFR